MVGARLVMFSSFFSPIIFRKSRRSVSVTPSGYEMASKIVAWGVFYSPLALQRLNNELSELYACVFFEASRCYIQINVLID